MSTRIPSEDTTGGPIYPGPEDEIEALEGVTEARILVNPLNRAALVEVVVNRPVEDDDKDNLVNLAQQIVSRHGYVRSNVIVQDPIYVPTWWSPSEAEVAAILRVQQLGELDE